MKKLERGPLREKILSHYENRKDHFSRSINKAKAFQRIVNDFLEEHEEEIDKEVRAIKKMVDDICATAV